VMLARCLGYLMLELPGSEARGFVANEVVACEANFDKMATLSQLYIDHLIRLFRKNKGHTPTPTEHPSRPSFDYHSTYFSEAVNPAPKDHQTAKRSALRRDKYRCVVTGFVDKASILGMNDTAKQVYNLNSNNPPMKIITNFCHIFPPSTNWGFDQNDPLERKRKYSGNVWAIVNSFRTIDILAELDGSKIHGLQNGLTMSAELHDSFDNLRLWFEHIENNTYRLHVLDNDLAIMALFPPNPIITFTSTNPGLPLPNPEYLKLHAAVCRVAHMCGAADYLDREDRDFDRMAVLARDGSSVNVLVSRLKYVLLQA